MLTLCDNVIFIQRQQSTTLAEMSDVSSRDVQCIMGNSHIEPTPSPSPIPKVMTPSGGHQNMYTWQAGGTHPTGMLSYFVVCRE